MLRSGTSYLLTATTTALLVALGAMPALAQNTTATATEDEAEVLTVIDDSPIASARASAMAGAVVTIADDLDAAFHNPAGIGGLGWEKKGKLPFIRKLYFPHATVGGNVRSIGLAKEIRSSGASTDSSVGKGLTDAHAGERQYARIGMLGGVVLGRTILAPFTDVQMAAVSHGAGSDLNDLTYRTLTGAGVGFSAQDPEGVFSLGYFGYSAQRSETSGTFTYDEVTDTQARSDAFDGMTVKSTATGHNAGFIWRMAKKVRPTLGVAVKNIGDTLYVAKGDGEDAVQKQDLTVGFSLSPEIGRNGIFHFVLAADRIEHDELSFAEKYRVGMELSLGGIGSYATFAARAGYQDAGASGGLSLNLGLVGLEASTHGVDIGAGNEKVVERRFVGSVYVNVAEF